MTSSVVILVVDDEEPLRTLLRRLLQPLRADARFAADCAAAEALLQSVDHLDLLVTDILLPDGTGIDVARRARERFPAVPIVVMTGLLNPDEEFKDLAELVDLRSDVLHKPFRVHEAVGVIRSRLGAPPTGA